jgi:hypothetical protein
LSKYPRIPKKAVAVAVVVEKAEKPWWRGRRDHDGRLRRICSYPAAGFGSDAAVGSIYTIGLYTLNVDVRCEKHGVVLRMLRDPPEFAPGSPGWSSVLYGKARTTDGSWPAADGATLAIARRLHSHVT